MMPVRRDSRLYFEKLEWVSSAMNIVGTPWTAVQRSISTVFKTSSASNAGLGRTMVVPWVTGHVGEHHPETVVERDGDAETVLFGKAHAFADDIAVVEHAMVGEDDAFGEPGGAARILDVNGVVKGEGFVPF